MVLEYHKEGVVEEDVVVEEEGVMEEEGGVEEEIMEKVAARKVLVLYLLKQ